MIKPNPIIPDGAQTPSADEMCWAWKILFEAVTRICDGTRCAHGALIALLGYAEPLNASADADRLSALGAAIGLAQERVRILRIDIDVTPHVITIDPKRLPRVAARDIRERRICELVFWRTRIALENKP